MVIRESQSSYLFRSDILVKAQHIAHSPESLHAVMCLAPSTNSPSYMHANPHIHGLRPGLDMA